MRRARSSPTTSPASAQPYYPVGKGRTQSEMSIRSGIITWMGVCIETLVRTGSDGDTTLETGPGSLESLLPPRKQKGSWSFISAPVCSRSRTGGKCTTVQRFLFLFFAPVQFKNGGTGRTKNNLGKTHFLHLLQQPLLDYWTWKWTISQRIPFLLIHTCPFNAPNIREIHDLSQDVHLSTMHTRRPFSIELSQTLGERTYWPADMTLTKLPPSIKGLTAFNLDYLRAYLLSIRFDSNVPQLPILLMKFLVTLKSHFFFLFLS